LNFWTSKLLKVMGDSPEQGVFVMQPQAQSTPTGTGNTLKSLILPSIRNFLLGVIALGVVLFLTAGTLDYWQAWVFIILFNVLVITQGIYLAIKDPELLGLIKE
jgi:hypothetical protein